MMNSTIKKVFKINNLYFVIGILLIIFIWFFAGLSVNNDIVVPSISDVFLKVINILTTSKYLKIVLLTILKLILIIACSSVFGYMLAILSYLSKAFKHIFRPIISFIRTLPIATVIVILLIYVGMNNTPIYICAFVIVPIIYEQVLVSFEGIDKNIIEETKMVSSVNLRVIFGIYLPITFPYFISSIFTVLGLGLKVLVMAEVFSQGQNTIGGAIQTARSILDTTSIFAWTVILLLIVLLFEMLIRVITNINLNKKSGI